MMALTSIVFTFPFEIDQCLFNDDKSLTNKQYVVIDAFDQRQFVKKNTLYLELFLNQGLTEFGLIARFNRGLSTAQNRLCCKPIRSKGPILYKTPL